MLRWKLLAIVGLGVALSFGLPVHAQAQIVAQQLRDDVPVLTRLWPMGVEAGKTCEITLTGERLSGVLSILCSDDVTLESVVKEADKQVRLRLTIRPDAKIGIFPFHLLSKAGLSNPRMLRIDSYSQSVENESDAKNDKSKNDTPETAQVVSVPQGISGRLSAIDEDYFRFQAAAGQRVVIDVEAHRLGSPTRPVLTLFDAQGHELAKAIKPTADVTPDVRLVYTFAKSGDYLIRITDRVFQGGDFCVYYLRLGDFAFATQMFPLGGRRGSNVSVKFRGGCLDEPVIHNVELNGEVRWQRRRLSVLTQTGRFVSPMMFAVGEHPEIVEKESNDKPETAQKVTMPVTVNGRIGRPHDRDCFRFHAAKGEKIVVRVLARELGSRLDAVVVIRDAKGRTLATADDSPRGDRLPPAVRPLRMSPTSDDPRLEFTAPADGDYVIAIDDRYYHGGGEYAYRLELAPPQSDFELIVQPGRVVNANNRRQARRRQRILTTFSGQGAGSLSIDRGGRGSLIVKVVRRGYNGPIRLFVEGLPKNLLVGETTIAAGQNQVELTFTAGFDAEAAAAFTRIFGAAEINGQSVVRQASHPVVFAAMPQSATALHSLDSVAIGISGQGAELALRGELAGPLTPGGKARVKLVVHRREGIKGEVLVRAISLPSGFAFPEVKIPAGKEVAEIELAASIEVKPGKRNLRLEAKLQVKGKKQPLLALAPLAVLVQPLLSLELVQQRLDVPRGGKVSVEIRVRRNGSSSSPIELTFSRLPRGVTVGPSTIPPGVKAFMLTIQAKNNASASSIRRIIQIRPQLKVGGASLELPTLRFALKIARQ